MPIGPHRRYTWVDATVEEFKAVKNALGGTLNDVVLTTVALALGRWLRGRGVDTEGLVLKAMVPVSVRAEAERGALGNRVAAMWAPLPVGLENPLAVYAEVHVAMRGLKESGQAVGAQALTQLADFAPPTIMSQAARLQARQRYFNVVVTNVPGPQMPLYLLGRELLAIYPVVPLARNQALGIAIMSYNGRLGLRAARRLRRAAGPRRRRRRAARRDRGAARGVRARPSPPAPPPGGEAEAGRAERDPAGMNGAIALVTGADNPQGIGRAVCHALAARGAVVACSVLPGSTAGEADLHAVPIEADLADPEAPEALLGAVEAFVGRPSILVNNAAHSTRDGYADLDAATLDAHWAVNVRAPALLSCALARHHPRGTPGRIVNLVSGQFLGPMPGELAYTASKGALQAFTVQLAAEVAPLGITVNAVGTRAERHRLDRRRPARRAPAEVPDGPDRPAGGRGGARGVPVLRGGGMGDGPGRARRGRVPARVSATEVDVAVVGAGIVGLAATDALLRRGASVLCLDAGAPGHGQSAGVARGFRHLHTDRALMRLAVRSRAGWRRLEERAGVELLERGGMVRLGADVEPEIAALRGIGVEARVLDRDEAHARMPWLAPEAGPLLFDPAAGALRARAAIAALAGLAHDALRLARVEAIEPAAGGVRLRTSAGEVRCARCLVCAGAGTERLVAPLGIAIARGGAPPSA